MKTLKELKCQKAVTWSLVVMFSFLQIVPTGWAAARPAEELQARGVSASVDPFANPTVAAPTLVPAPQGTVGFVDSTAFQLNESPLSPATPESAGRQTMPDSELMPVTYPGVELPKAELSGQVSEPAGSSVTTLPEMPEPSVETMPMPQNMSDAVPQPLELAPVEEPETDLFTIDNSVGTPTTVITTITVAPPANTTIVTDPATGKEISVTIDSRNIATVTWGEESYKGVFDPYTNSILLVADSDAIWTLQFGKKDDGSLYLQSFKTESWSANGYATENYTFNDQGQLIRKDWLTENNGYYFPIIYKEGTASLCANFEKGGCLQPMRPSYRSGGTIDYVTINGKTLVSHEKTWSEGGKYPYYTLDYSHVEKTDTLIYPYPAGRSETEAWYSYDNQGNLLAKNWNSTNSRGDNIFGQELYVHINGKDLVSVRRIWQYGSLIYGEPIYRLTSDDLTIDPGSERILLPYSKYSNYRSETYYSYDAQGNMVAEVNTWEGFDYNGTRYTGASYWHYNGKNGTWESGYAEDGFDILQVRSAADWKIIASAADRKTVYVGASAENRWNYTHYVQYTRNSDGTMTAKAVYDQSGNAWIVRGEPDILSGGSDDIKFENNQQVNGQYVYYQEYWHSDNNGNWVSDGYRLIFNDQVTWAQTAVDFPANDTVILNGKNYKITIDQDGILTLTEIPPAIPPAVQAYVDALRAQLPDFLVSVVSLQLCGEPVGCTTQYTVTITDPKVYLKSPTSGLKAMSLWLTADAQIAGMLPATYYGSGGDIKVDGWLLFEALHQLPQMPEGQDLRALVNMAKLVVVSVNTDGTIHFVLNGRTYRCYRTPEGNVILEQEQTPEERAIAEVKASLAATMGLHPKTLEGLIESITYENGRVIVKLKSGVMGDGRLINLLGSNALPTSATYQFDAEGNIISAVMSWQESYSVFLRASIAYGQDGKIIAVEWIRENIGGPSCPVCMDVQTPSSEVLSKDLYDYLTDGSIMIRSYNPLLYGQDPATDLRQEIVLKLLGDGKYHINEVRKYAKGQLVDVSRFDYLTLSAEMPGHDCGVKQYCPPVVTVSVELFRIVRTDAQGQTLSEIKTASGTIMLPNGNSKVVAYSSLAELLDLARQFEQENIIPPPVQAYVALIQGQSPGYLVTATPVAGQSSQYIIHVVCQGIVHMNGSLKGYNFTVAFSEGGTGVDVLAETVTAEFYGVSPNPDGFVLWKGLWQLFGGNTPQGMTQITVTAVDPNGAIHFTTIGVSYDCYRDANNNVIVVPSLPSGWTRAASNPNFGYQLVVAPPGNDFGKWNFNVLNLLTGETVVSHVVWGAPWIKVSVADVSPDGKVVVYSIRGVPNAEQIKVYNLTDLSQGTSFSGVATAVTFGTDGTVLIESNFSSALGQVTTIDLVNFLVKDTYYKLLDPAAVIVDEGYVLISSHNIYSNTFTVAIYDASAGTDHLVPLPVGISYHASQSGGGSSGSGSFRTIDVYRTAGGQAVLTVGISAVGNLNMDYSQTFIINLGAGAQLTLPGAATAVTYEGNIATYTLTRPDGSVETKYVNLEMLQVINFPVPSAVQAYVDELKEALGTGFSVTVTANEDGTYSVLVRDVKKYTRTPVSGLKEMSFVLGASGELDKASLKLSYYASLGKTLQPNGALMYDAVCKLTAGPRDGESIFVLDQIAEMHVLSVGRDGSVTFVYRGVRYQASRGIGGRIVVKKLKIAVV